MNYLFLIYIAMPAFAANMLPVIAGKYGWLPQLALPIQKNIFGKNKTWRGLAIGTLGAVLAAIIQYIFYHILYFPYFNNLFFAIAFGWLAGAGALIGDMFFSMIKRALGIASGRPFIPFDQIDYILGFLLFTSIIFNWRWQEAIFLLLFALIINPLTNVISYLFGVKDTYW